MKKVILLLVSILLICLAYAFAAVPCKINYQGRLIKDNVPVHNTAGIPMIFKLFNTATGIEGEKVVYSGNVPVYNGLFRVVLDLEGVNWTAGEAKYLQVIVDKEPLSPREALYAYPYAINSHLLEGATKEYFLNTSTDTQKKDGGLNIMGNVGIGMTSPGFKLQTYDATNSAIAATDSTTPVTTKIQSTDSAGWVGTHTNHPLYFFINNSVTPMMAINTAGNVGIGTTAPGMKLDVNGDVRATGTIYGKRNWQETKLTATASSGTSWGDIMSVSITTKGGDLLVYVSGCKTSDAYVPSQDVLFRVVRGETTEFQWLDLHISGLGSGASIGQQFRVTGLSAGTYTFMLQTRMGTSGTVWVISGARLGVIEF